MTKRSIIILLGVFLSIAVFAARTQSETGGSNQTTKSPNTERPRNMTEQERNKELEKFIESLRDMTPEQAIKAIKRYRERKRAEMRRQWELKKKELAKEGRGPRISTEQRRKERRNRAAERRKEWEKKKEEAGGFIFPKYALDATEDQWKLIKPKLEKVRQLRDQARSTVGVRLTSSSNSGAGARANVPVFQWHKPWKDKASSELTKAQKLAKQLIALVERKYTTPEQFRRTMDALRKARREEAEIERQLAEAQEELREVLTTRQEAALVLMKWL